MGQARPRAIVLDAGALIAFDRANERMRALVREASKANVRLIIPAGVLGQVWRGSPRQAALRALVKGPTTVVPALDQVLAEAAGALCGRAGSSDVVDASVVLLARREGGAVVTSDVDDLRRLDPSVRLERI